VLQFSEVANQASLVQPYVVLSAITLAYLGVGSSRPCAVRPNCAGHLQSREKFYESIRPTTIRAWTPEKT
jgi:hypothetical protein